ncbi:myo-inositol-1(or 4)-monophosphatase [Streptomyces sp. WMMB 714]|uniref:inositol monophosphatase family protein n=1 Tax=Streptomyces sp. WMMB 714 TaxID=1286822 RepID=UPI000823E038|nr:inositol monophosphatase [Streptomyces sp. WMMB 714]SCK44454.1 myo-inositol-1(or 4)-monophosphatase [Streptomyces sp. WMMB 714]
MANRPADEGEDRGGGRGAGTGGSGPTAGGGAYSLERRVAVAAAEEAGAMLRERFEQAYTVRSKGGDGDVVTDLDLSSEKLILARLQTHFPHDRILSEEAGLFDAVGRRTWLVDPLDGSNNVAVGLTAYAVGLGLCVAGEPVLGVVHEPVTGRTWSAVAGRGAYSGEVPLPGPPGGVPDAGPVVAWTQGHAVGRKDSTARELRGALELRSRRVLQLWAPLLGWSMLARGTIDGFVGYCAEAVDFPAGALLASEAGAVFRTLTGGPFQVGFTGPDSERSFVAARPEVLPYLLDAVAGAAGPGDAA